MHIKTLLENEVRLFLNDLIEDVEFYNSLDNLKFFKEIGKESFIINIYIDNNDLNLTNLLLPKSMRYKGVSILIIDFLCTFCTKNNYNLLITNIVTDNWKKSLINRGAVETTPGNILINNSKWIAHSGSEQLKFVNIDNELILESESELYKKMKNDTINKVLQILNSLGASIDLINQNGYVEQIIADTSDDTYVICFNYNTINCISKLLIENKFENYLSVNNFIGVF